MLGKLLTLGITVFWLAMMALLMQREVLPAWRAARETAQSGGYAQLEKLAAEGRVSQMGIYLGNRRIGRTVSRVARDGNELVINNEARISLNLSSAAATLPGAEGDINLVFRFTARVGEGRLLNFRLDVVSPPGNDPVAIVDGVPVGESLTLKIHKGGQTQTQSIPFDSRQPLFSDMAPSVLPGNLRVGDRWMIRSLDPTAYAVRSAWATVVGTESIAVGGREISAFVITIPYGSQEVRIWARPNGEVLKQKLFGFTFVREEPEPEADQSKRP